VLLRFQTLWADHLKKAGLALCGSFGQMDGLEPALLFSVTDSSEMQLQSGIDAPDLQQLQK
jgi:hypothetical protein